MLRKSAKDKTAYLFNRYVWLIDLISRKKELTFEEINEYWLRSSLNENEEDFPLRTFHNHREAIGQMFDINIECDKRGGYKYYIDGMDDIKNDTLRNWFLNTFSVGNLLQEQKSLHHRILLENVPSGREFLGQIVEAMKANFQIEMMYQSFYKDQPQRAVVYPYCVKIFKQRWYVIAHNPARNALRTYALDRIKELTITSETFVFPTDFEPNTYFENNFGIITDETIEPETIRIKAYEKKSKYLKSLPLHHSQKEVKQEGQCTIFEYYLSPTYDFLQEILSHGAETEVLSSEWFRNQIKEIIRQMNDFYE